MRIWALASCGGLLALAACSAEQSNTPDPSAAPPDGDDAAQVTAQPRATASSPTARPDVRSGQSLQNRVRLSPSVSRPSTTTPQPPSSSQLRERVQRLRAQHGSRLAPSTPLKTVPAPQVTNTPLYNNLQPPTPQPAQPLPSRSSFSGENSTPENVTVRLENAPRSVSELQPPTVLPTSPMTPPELSAPLHDTTTDLGPVVTANVAGSYPIAPLRHQGHSSLFQRQTVVLNAPAAPEFTVARVHGGTPTPAIASPEVATGLADPTEAAATPEASPEPPPIATTDEETLSTEVSPIPAAASGAATAHQSSGNAALTLARQNTVELTPGNGAGAHQSGGKAPNLAAAPLVSAQSGATPRPASGAIANRPAGAIAQPESLPLSPAAPRLSSPSLENNSAQEDLDLSTTRPEVAPSLAQSPMAELAALIATPEGSATPAHIGQAAPETLQLATPGENPKNLIAAYCLTSSGVPLPLGGDTQGSTAPLPKFSPSNQADASLDLGVNPEKAEVTLCQETSSPAPAHESTLEPALVAN